MLIYASAPPNFEELLLSELRSLLDCEVNSHVGGAQFDASEENLFKALTHSRLANRMYACVGQLTLDSDANLFEALKDFPWSEHMTCEHSFKIDAAVRKNTSMTARFVMYKAKDAIADSFMELYGKRPNVNTSDADISFFFAVYRNTVSVYIDLTKEALFQRNYRVCSVEAPLKENLAAALLMRSTWYRNPQDWQLADLFCGSATFLIEAVGIANKIPPAHHWKAKAMTLWKHFNHDAFEAYLSAIQDVVYPLTGLFYAVDNQQGAVLAAQKNLEAAGFSDLVELSCLSALDFLRSENTDRQRKTRPWFFISNLPYGKRIGELQALRTLFQSLGELLKNRFGGSEAAFLLQNNELSDSLAVRPSKVNKVKNGAIDCLFLQYSLFGQDERQDFAEKSKELSDGAQMFANRLKKNAKKLKKYLKAGDISCYRIYDADMKEYNAAVDVYDNKYLHVQEYAPPKTVEKAQSQKRLQEILSVLPQFFSIPRRQIFLKQRKIQKGKQQYSKLDQSSNRYLVQEAGLQFYVNFTDYLDSGIFLDHRITRAMIRERANQKRFLNLFAYTGTATVYAAAGSAKKTVSVDASNTYLTWAQENMHCNGFTGKQHIYVRANCLTWLKECHEQFDLIFLDPPTFSNSKTYNTSFSIEHDHVELIKSCMRLLSANGELIFSNNFRKFVMDPRITDFFQVRDLGKENIPLDFERNQKIHHCYLITH